MPDEKTVVQSHKNNFETLRMAFANNDVMLMECTLKASGEKVAVICTSVLDGLEWHTTPFAIFLNGNPFELL
jgi:hypothetical protein